MGFPLSDFDEQYKVPLIAKILHSLPHYNITFHKTNDTFRPTDEVYLEVSLLIKVTLPIAQQIKQQQQTNKKQRYDS